MLITRAPVRVSVPCNSHRPAGGAKDLEVEKEIDRLDIARAEIDRLTNTGKRPRGTQ